MKLEEYLVILLNLRMDEKASRGNNWIKLKKEETQVRVDEIYKRKFIYFAIGRKPN